MAAASCLVAANTTRQVLLDHARRRCAAKRDGAEARRVDIEAELVVSHSALDHVIAIDEALMRLSAIDPRQARLIELRFFGGLTVEEAAAAMGISEETAKRDWRSAKSWLQRDSAPAKSQ